MSRFTQLPTSVVSDLHYRGCNIVARRDRGPDSVISGDFSGSGKPDWAVLCQQGDHASLLVYFTGRSTPFVLNSHMSGLDGDSEGARAIRVADWDYVAEHNPGFAPPKTTKVCIDDGTGMGSAIYCYLNEKWVVLNGAD